LGSQSNDIDIALSDYTGAPFAQYLKEYASDLGIETGKVAVIQKNPEQSKHLEAATLKIYGLELDFVNLRSEEYTSASRIPTIVSFSNLQTRWQSQSNRPILQRHGTPTEDAFRRDATINSMFYNIHTKETEDLTGRVSASAIENFLKQR
jgi:tRNA nucleotidyltransferase (CCA-adding enzyme)